MSSAMAREETRSAWLFLAPSLLLFAVFVLLPVLAAFGISFSKWDLFTEPHWAGLDNYRQLLFEDKLFHKVMSNTFFYYGGKFDLSQSTSSWSRQAWGARRNRA